MTDGVAGTAAQWSRDTTFLGSAMSTTVHCCLVCCGGLVGRSSKCQAHGGKNNLNMYKEHNHILLDLPATIFCTFVGSMIRKEIQTT